LRLLLTITCAIQLAAGSAAFAIEPWRPLLPDGWLAVASTPDVETAEKKFAALLDDVGLQYNSVFAALKAAAGIDQLRLGRGDVVLGLAQSESNSPAYWFALAPTRDFADLLDSLGGEMTGDVGVATLLGVDLCVAPCGDWAIVTSLDQRQIARQAMQRGVKAPDRHAGEYDLALELSTAGIELLAVRAKQGDEQHRERTLRGALVWPPRLEVLDAALARNQPLLACWSKLFDGLRAEATVRDTGQLKLQLSAPLRQQPTVGKSGDGHSGDGQAVVELPVLAPNTPTIATAHGSGRAAIAEPLLQLNLAYAEGRADELGARRYSAQPFAEFRTSAAVALGQIKGFTAGIVSHQDKQAPLYSNQLAIVAVEDADAFLSTSRDLIDKWNSLIKESQPEVALLFRTHDLTLAGLEGVLFDVDMVEAMKLGTAPEVREIMDQFFGGKGRYGWRVLKLNDSRVLIMDLPTSEAERMAQLMLAAQAQSSISPAEPWQVEVRLDRYLHWQQSIQRVMQATPAKPNPPATSGSPTLEIQLSTKEGKLQVTAHTTRDSIKALGDLVQANN